MARRADGVDGVNEFHYNAQCDPPLPVCDVVLTVLSTGLRATLTATIDTGADGTIVPIRYLRQIGAAGHLRPTCAASGVNAVSSFFTWLICKLATLPCPACMWWVMSWARKPYWGAMRSIG